MPVPRSTFRVPPLLLGALLLGPAPAAAQVPTRQAIEQALQQPGLAEQLRSRIRDSGLTPEQVRARLRASGYPESLLDAYITADAGAPGAA
ncbi:MAG: hypothetical protein ACREMJ_00945, partial [Gemmatimonadales bacterium]